MSRFIELGDDMINADHIVRVKKDKKGQLTITMDDGDVLMVPKKYWDDIYGGSQLLGLYPCKNLAALYEIDGEPSVYPVSVLGLTASGELRPMDEDFRFLDYNDHGVYCGMESYDMGDED